MLFWLRDMNTQPGIISLPAAVIYLLNNARENVSIQHWSNSSRHGRTMQGKKK